MARDKNRLGVTFGNPDRLIKDMGAIHPRLMPMIMESHARRQKFYNTVSKYKKFTPQKLRRFQIASMGRHPGHAHGEKSTTHHYNKGVRAVDIGLGSMLTAPKGYENLKDYIPAHEKYMDERFRKYGAFRAGETDYSDKNRDPAVFHNVGKDPYGMHEHLQVQETAHYKTMDEELAMRDKFANWLGQNAQGLTPEQLKTAQWQVRQPTKMNRNPGIYQGVDQGVLDERAQFHYEGDGHDHEPVKPVQKSKRTRPAQVSDGLHMTDQEEQDYMKELGMV